jgi:hypothetical protein
VSQLVCIIPVMYVNVMYHMHVSNPYVHTISSSSHFTEFGVNSSITQDAVLQYLLVWISQGSVLVNGHLFSELQHDISKE